MDRTRSRISAEVICPRGASGRRTGAPIWGPWLLAPLFALAPVAGCALAGKVKQSAIGQAAASAGGPLTAPAVTFGDPPPAPAPAGTAAPVVPIAPTVAR